MGLHLLASHPKILSQLHNEVDAVLDGRPATWNDIPQLELTRRILTETTRIHSPALLTTRRTTAETELGGIHIPAQTDLFLSPYILHLRSDAFPDPRTFDPDRWLPDRPAPPRGSCVPFGGGTPRCIGDDFALTEAILALSTLTARFELRLDPSTTTSTLVRGAVGRIPSACSSALVAMRRDSMIRAKAGSQSSQDLSSVPLNA
ncbi:cytochrome P450 [Streptomyces sp. NPDC056480]|uniref:cytochrome P450 n=1 Tax=Streptomyces sp. NPDC056480 TaxID=3345833 RepID=UPI00367CF45B